MAQKRRRRRRLRVNGKRLPGYGKALPPGGPPPRHGRERAAIGPGFAAAARMTGNLFASLWDPLAFALVVGGALLCALLRTPWGDARRAIRAVPRLFRPDFAAEPLLDQLAGLVRIARRHGVIALDRAVIADADVRLGVEAAVDGEDAGAIAARVEAAIAARLARQQAAAAFWAAAAEAAPAMGMVGTLIGLARIFRDLQDPAAIGGAMAVALLTTLYGALVASLVAGPVAARLGARAEAEAAGRRRLVRPLAALAA